MEVQERTDLATESLHCLSVHESPSINRYIVLLPYNVEDPLFKILFLFMRNPSSIFLLLFVPFQTFVRTPQHVSFLPRPRCFFRDHAGQLPCLGECELVVDVCLILLLANQWPL